MTPVANINPVVRRLSWAFVWVMLWWLLSGCNHLFYHPDYEIRANPSVLKLPYREYWLTPEEDVRIHLWHMDAGVESRGTIVHFHGNAENMSTHFLFSAWLVKSGYDVVTFDYRGYGQSRGIPTREGLIRDSLAVFEWVKNHKKLGKQDLFIFGQSLGGAVAIPAVVLAQSQPEYAAMFRGVIVDSTFSSYRRITRDRLGTFWLTWPLQWPLSFLVSDDFSPIDFIKDLRSPLLVVHGARDPVVPLAFGKELYDATAADRREMWEVDLAGHTSAFFQEVTPYKPRLVAWLCRHGSRSQKCP